MRRLRTGTSPEERVAMRIKTIVEDLNLDLETTGVMLARVLPQLTYTRLETILEAMQYEREAVLDPNVMRQRWRDGLQ
jgi:hypothetical protein